jgi:F-type H+-transporting ATPase subunit delta
MADIGTIARPYARAAFEVAQAGRQLAAWSEALGAAAAVLGDAQARRYLARPDVDDASRVAFVEAICTAAGAEEIWRSRHGQNLLAVLAKNGRLEALPAIAAQFEALKAAAENTVRVTLTAATGVDSGLAAKVSTSLERKLGRKVELAVAVDATLIGGAVIRADDSVIDGSIKSSLRRLAEKLTA